MVAAPIVSRRHHDALALAAHILGAPLTGRLDARLREERGYTYSMTATLYPLRPSHSVFLINGAVDAQAAIPALYEVLGILRTAHEDGFTEAEFAKARDNVCYSLPLLYESALTVAAHARETAAHGLGEDFIPRSVAAIEQLTREDVDTAFRSHIGPGRLSIIAVGDPSLRAPVGDQLSDLACLPVT